MAVVSIWENSGSFTTPKIMIMIAVFHWNLEGEPWFCIINHQTRRQFKVLIMYKVTLDAAILVLKLLYCLNQQKLVAGFFG